MSDMNYVYGPVPALFSVNDMLAEFDAVHRAIDMLESEGFHSEIADHFDAILSIIRRHPMNQHEVLGFLETRGCGEAEKIIRQPEMDDRVEPVHYKGYLTFPLKL